MIEVWQAEWCQHSARVRALLTDLQLDAVMHQVPREPSDRDVMRGAVGTDEMPAVVLEDGTILTGDTDGILAELRRRFSGPGGEAGAGAGGHAPAATPETADRPLGVPAGGGEVELPGFPQREPPSDG